MKIIHESETFVNVEELNERMQKVVDVVQREVDQQRVGIISEHLHLDLLEIRRRFEQYRYKIVNGVYKLNVATMRQTSTMVDLRYGVMRKILRGSSKGGWLAVDSGFIRLGAQVYPHICASTVVDRFEATTIEEHMLKSLVSRLLMDCSVVIKGGRVKLCKDNKTLIELELSSELPFRLSETLSKTHYDASSVISFH